MSQQCHKQVRLHRERVFDVDCRYYRIRCPARNKNEENDNQCPRGLKRLFQCFLPAVIEIQVGCFNKAANRLALANAVEDTL